MPKILSEIELAEARKFRSVILIYLLDRYQSASTDTPFFNIYRLDYSKIYPPREVQQIWLSKIVSFYGSNGERECNISRLLTDMEKSNLIESNKHGHPMYRLSVKGNQEVINTLTRFVKIDGEQNAISLKDYWEEQRKKTSDSESEIRLLDIVFGIENGIVNSERVKRLSTDRARFIGGIESRYLLKREAEMNKVEETDSDEDNRSDSILDSKEMPPRIDEPTWDDIYTDYVRSGDYQGAIGICDTALEDMPENIRIKLAKARMLREIGRRKDASDLYTCIIDEDPENDDAFYELGMMLAADRRTRKAMNYLETARKIHLARLGDGMRDFDRDSDEIISRYQSSQKRSDKQGDVSTSIIDKTISSALRITNPTDSDIKNVLALINQISGPDKEFKSQEGLIYRALADMETKRGQLDSAASYFEKSKTIFKALGNLTELAETFLQYSIMLSQKFKDTNDPWDKKLSEIAKEYSDDILSMASSHRVRSIGGG